MYPDLSSRGCLQSNEEVQWRSARGRWVAVARCLCSVGGLERSPIETRWQWTVAAAFDSSSQGMALPMIIINYVKVIKEDCDYFFLMLHW